MTTQIEAIFEHGVLRPLNPVKLSEGEVVEIILLKRTETPSGKKTAELLSDIAALPLESPADGFSGRDHDSVLYDWERDQ